MYLALANLVMVLHGLLVVCVVSGIVLAICGILKRYRIPEYIFYLLVVGVLTSQFAYGECIMTVWEKSLRNRYMPGSAYHNSCIGHYLPWIPPIVYSVIGPCLLILSILALPFWRYRDYRDRQRLPAFACVRQRDQAQRETTSPEQKEDDEYPLRESDPAIGTMTDQEKLNHEHAGTGAGQQAGG